MTPETADVIKFCALCAGVVLCFWACAWYGRGPKP